MLAKMAAERESKFSTIFNCCLSSLKLEVSAPAGIGEKQLSGGGLRSCVASSTGFSLFLLFLFFENPHS